MDPRNLQLTAIPARHDNYIWMIDDGRHALIVDPGEAAPVRAILAQRNLQLTTILVTHHHGDHVEGVASLCEDCDGVRVYGNSRDPGVLPLLTDALDAGCEFTIGAPCLRISVIAVAGHTLGHVAFHARPWLFCGDTLFSGGCGRLFEGSAAQMHDSLCRLAALPDDTLVCCGHEYTLANLAFAAHVEPDNQAIGERLRHCRDLRQQQQPTLPSTLGIEKSTNPFLRVNNPGLKQRLGLPQDAGSVAAFTILRQQKDVFRTT